MSQHTVYKCDHCDKEIGKKPHVSLNLSSVVSGISLPPKSKRNNSSSWNVKSILGFLHFCTPSHISAYFTNKIKEATQ